MKFKYGIIALLCPFLSLGQSRSLSIGDELPQAMVHRIINYPVAEIQLSAFKEKLLILDFFAGWCGPCLKNFPRLDSLQSQFKKHLRIVLVNSTNTGENEERVAALFRKRKKPGGRPWTFPVIVNDSSLLHFFPHRIIPHYVWVYRGKVAAITFSKEVTASNIKALLRHDRISLPVKSDN